MRVLIGIGNAHRRDDGVGPALVERVSKLLPPNVRASALDGEPAGLLDVWAGARLAIVVNAVLHRPARPGQIHRTTTMTGPTSPFVTEAVKLGQAKDRLPDRLIAYAVEAADLGDGTELSPAVAAALPELLDAVLTDIWS